MTIRLGMLALVAVAAAATPAAAQSMLTKLTTEEVGAAITAAGHQFQVETSEDGSPSISVVTDGSKAQQILVQFFECDPKGACEDILIWSWYSVPGLTVDKINSWNQNGRWTRAYIDADKDPRLEMDINATGGIGTEALDILVNTFFNQDGEFSKHLGL